jgi:hypothetical protein
MAVGLRRAFRFGCWSDDHRQSGRRRGPKARRQNAREASEQQREMDRCNYGENQPRQAQEHRQFEAAGFETPMRAWRSSRLQAGRKLPENAPEGLLRRLDCA